MWRALLFLGLIALAAYGAVWLANNPETVAVTWAGREYSTSLAVGVVVFVAAAILLALALGAIRFLVGLPGAIRRASERRRAARGRHALTRGIVAVAAGDLTSARRYSGEAARLLGRDPLALLLRAQAAQVGGDRDAAETAFRDMLASPETRVLGLRGLYVEARRRGDLVAAREYAEEAARAAPALGWASEAVLEGYSADGDWKAAIRFIERRTSLGLIDRATSRRQRAVLLTADALQREPHDPDGALAAAERAVQLAPDLVPAAALAGRLLSRRGDLKRGARIIETAWSATPHPELAAAYLNLRPGDSAIDRLRRAETLARLSSWSAEARLAIARTAIDARELDRAREVLRPLLEESEAPTVRLCLTMAEIESKSGNAGATREWLARAARAPRDKAWIADGVVSETWAPVSPVTGRLDAFVWDTPPEALGGPSPAPAIGFEPEEADTTQDVPLFLGRDRQAVSTSPEQAVAPAGSAPAVPGASGGETEAGPAREGPVASGSVPAREAPAPEVATPGATEAVRQVEPASAPAAPDKAQGPKEVRTQAGAPVPGSGEDKRSPNGSGRAPRARPFSEPGPVIFPVPRAPDDPGPETEGEDRQRFRVRV